MAKKDKFFVESEEIGIPSQNIELDPRSVSTADGMPRNYIPTGDETEVKMPLGQPTVNKVGGQKRMLASKKSTVKWY